MTTATQLAANPRTATKATIKRASRKARSAATRLDKKALTNLSNTYKQAGDDIRSIIQSYADNTNTLRLEVMRDLLGQVDQRLSHLNTLQDQLLDNNMLEAARLGTVPWAESGVNIGFNLNNVPHETLNFMRSFVAEDGLQLSDRLWRVNQNGKELVARTIQSHIIQGNSASNAIDQLVRDGVPIPVDLQEKLGLANADKVSRVALQELLRKTGNPRAHALRIFRTEINRAHGEAYMATGEQVEGFGGWRFLLSPRHPKPDICDMHASVNIYGLGPGVYPDRDRNPWPAHPNTLSYVAFVFKDEVTAEDKAGKSSRLDWLKQQPPGVQESVLASRRKAVALRKNILRQNEIATPWKVLKPRYERRGINIDQLRPDKSLPPQLERPVIFGSLPGGVRNYLNEAFADAPGEINQIIKKTRPPESVTIARGGGSYFLHNSIVIDPRSMSGAGKASKYEVYRHELGHHVDFWATAKGTKQGPRLSITPDKDGGLLTSYQTTRKSLEARSTAAKARRAGLNKYIDNNPDVYLADLFGALTRNKIGFGHSVRYLSRPGFSETEVFANLFNIYSRKDRKAWNFVVKELPYLATGFEQLIKRLVK